MVSKRVTESLTNAKSALDTLKENGELAFDICDGILTNIKGFVHDEIVWGKINKHEEKVHQEFQRRLKKANEELKQRPPMDTFNEGMERYLNLRHWKSLEMLNFYDKLSKEHEI